MRTGGESGPDDKPGVALSDLTLRLARELARMTALCHSIETAVSGVMKSVKDPDILPVIHIQGLDLLRQNLGDYARLAELLASADPGADQPVIACEEILKTLVLRENTERFTQITPQKKAADNGPADPVIWL